MIHTLTLVLVAHELGTKMPLKPFGISEAVSLSNLVGGEHIRNANATSSTTLGCRGRPRGVWQAVVVVVRIRRGTQTLKLRGTLQSHLLYCTVFRVNCTLENVDMC